MRKKLFLVHGTIIFLSLLSLLIVSIFMMFSLNEKNTQKQLTSYLDVAKSVLVEERKTQDEETSIKNTANILIPSNTNLRLTIIGMDGSVKYDSNKSEIEENHLSRPEITHLGKVTKRYSETLKTDMMYLAGLDSANNLYVRVAIPISAINDQVNSTIAIAIGVFIIVLVLSIVIDYYCINSSLKPLKAQVNRLSRIVSNEDDLPKEIEIESLSYQVDKTKDIIVEKINSLTEEQEKLRFIINSMNQGLLIVDEKMDVVLLNDYVRRLFHYEDKDNASIFDVTVLPEFSELFHSTLKKEDQQKEVRIEDRYYLVTTTSFSADWLGVNKNGVSYSITDVTIDKNLEKAKRDFFANASHELKSPLTSIIGYSEMIKNGFVTEKEDVNEELDRILFESKRMNEIVIEMLELSRLEAKEMTALPETISLKEIWSHALMNMETQIQEKGIEIITTGEDFPVTMIREDCQSLVNNLLENAIRYNKDKGSITLTLDNHERTLSLHDTGIGIPKKYQERIFERFFRVDKARSRKLGGTGLGLSIVKHICLNYNITIDLESKEDEFTTFTLHFPAQVIKKDK
jgi:two-component system, OmpR family, phosphate regulon sensor histidine kinase PhoR